ncbi:MFS transporter [Acidithiobacillus montserratensis]|uniref:MFS transporter n=1 Tax=Acidithiobacillus montserratensis TaxID=2729135 RepID=A0ACD5HJ28_9PROT|nr:MFS transporter [Acidithiobacillus montserratensis]MBN2680660.1 MFS transporter [Acidithiobacillaceae bacterium]MBU2746710.1 MFS transporter [Acidithiobacillus montserratensis]
MTAAAAPASRYQRGIAHNRGQFLLQTVQVFFVGLVIGMERNVLPAMSAHFGVNSHAFFFLASFVIAFGLVKGALNFVAGGLSDRIGRKRVLFIGWIAGIPIPILIFFAPNWWWIIAANVFLGFNQAFTWTMTVTSQIDLSANHQRGLAVGINEAMGYIAVGLAGLATGYLAVLYGPRWALLVFGLVVIALALVLLLWMEDTIHWVRAEHTRHGAAIPGASPARSMGSTFLQVSFQDRTYRALCQGGVANKIADTLVWVLFPVFFTFHGLGVIAIGWITGTYAMVWGLCQFWTGHLADRLGRRPPVLMGFALLSAGLAGTALVSHFSAWMATAALMGLGMALLYPNLIAAMSDVAPPLERGRILGTYRYWRDTGYAIGGVILGLVAQWSDKILPAIWVTAGIVALSGLWIAFAVQETHPRTG